MKIVYALTLVLLMSTMAQAAYFTDVVIKPYTRYGMDTSAGGPVVDLIDLGDTYDYIEVTCNDSCVIGLLGQTLNLSNGDFVDRCFILPFKTRYLYVISECEYVYPRAIRVRGLK